MENDNLDDLQDRIRQLKQDSGAFPPSPESAPKESNADRQGLGVAYELIATPVVCGGMGMGLDHVFETRPFFFITLAFLGVLAGFWRVYKVAQGIETPLDLKRLQRTEKQGRNTQLSEDNTEQS